MIAHHTNANATPTIPANTATNQKRSFTCISLQPINSKWWCNGAILNNRCPVPYIRRVNLNYPTCSVTLVASATNTSPITGSNSHCPVMIATNANVAPSARLPVSPMNNSAG